MYDAPKRCWETDVFDLETVIDGERNDTLAVAKITNLFLEGLHDTLTLPEIKSEVAETAHHLLGCDNWTAMFLLASILHDAADTPEVARKYIDTILRDHLLHFAVGVVQRREPIGECTCEEATHG